MKIVQFEAIATEIKGIKSFENQPLFKKKYSNNDYFILFEEDVVLENLQLNNIVEGKNIAGYIFLKNLEVKKQITSLDAKYSPFFAVFGNVKAAAICLAGNTYFVDGNVDCSALFGFYNHGLLTVNGSLTNQVLYSDNFSFEFGAINQVGFIIGEEKAFYKDTLYGKVRLTRSHSNAQFFNKLGKNLITENTLFQYLIQDDEDQPEITHTTLDFYENFSEKMRFVFDEIFKNPLFDTEENVSITKKNNHFDFKKTADHYIIIFINTESIYSTAIVFNPKENVSALNLTFFKDDSFEEIHCEFDLEEDDISYQANSVKHCFFKAKKVWDNYTVKLKTKQNKERKKVIEQLQLYGFESRHFETFYPKSGFHFPNENHWTYEKVKNTNLLPIFQFNANYLCVYKEGILRGKICEWHHVESVFSPMWKSIESLFSHLKNQRYCEDWIYLTKDYPLSDDTFSEEDQIILDTLHKTYNEVKDVEEDFENYVSEQNKNYDLKLQTVFSICHFTPPKKMAELIPFLNDKDMFVQERVIYILGKNNYYQAKDKFQEIAQSTKGNQQMAAESVLLNWQQDEFKN